ncbi:hypothetical protein JZX88_13275 [Agrobacterium sp. OT33]|nr:hypothetical protein [Agrobacterium sp. OT33]
MSSADQQEPSAMGDNQHLRMAFGFDQKNAGMCINENQYDQEGSDVPVFALVSAGDHGRFLVGWRLQLLLVCRYFRYFRWWENVHTQPRNHYRQRRKIRQDRQADWLGTMAGIDTVDRSGLERNEAD